MNHQSYSFRGFLLNPLSRELWHEGEAIPLSSSAFDCLVYLVEHRERPIGRDELISAVWARADVSDSLLAQTIVRLRRALGEDGKEQQIIRTILRVGYRWIADTVVHAGPPAADLATNRATLLPSTSKALPNETDGPPTYRFPPTRRRVRIIGTTVAAIVLSVCFACFALAHRQLQTWSMSPAKRSLTVVLPAKVNAPAQWNWLGLGVMALVADQIKIGDVQIVSNPTVLALMNNDHQLTPQQIFFKPELGISTTIQPTVLLKNGIWTVRLTIGRANEAGDDVQAASANVLQAAHDATDLLLVRIGETRSDGHQSEPVAN